MESRTAIMNKINERSVTPISFSGVERR